MIKPALLLATLIGVLSSACNAPQPTGSIAFSSDRDGDQEIYLVNPDGSPIASSAAV